MDEREREWQDDPQRIANRGVSGSQTSDGHQARASAEPRSTTAGRSRRNRSAEQSGPPAPAAYSLHETAELLRVSYDTVRAMITRGELPAVEYARRKWVPRWVIDRLFADRDAS